MGIDYYSVLEIHSYARVAVRERPERTRNCSDQELSAERMKLRHAWFKLAAEAFEVLSCPLLRAAFDQYGEEGLKNGVPARDPELYLKPWKFHGDPLKTYRSFFGTESACVPMLLSWQVEGKVRRPDGDSGPWFREAPLRVPLELPLELVASGGRTEVSFTRRELTGDGLLESRTRDLQLLLPPGVQPGTSFLFQREGHQALNSIPGDVEVMTADAPHRELRREGASDLVARFRVSLEEALLGCAVTLNTLDARTLRVRITDVITPDYELRLVGEGLPLCEAQPARVTELDRVCYVRHEELRAACREPAEPCLSCGMVVRAEKNDPEMKESPCQAEPCLEQEVDSSPRGDLVLRFEVEWPRAVPVTHRASIRAALLHLTPHIPHARAFVEPLRSADKCQ
ncbi:hypothetical protein B566_EDAN007496 [Ephemera danica]|nr:hypothetical protein B566_EDAN007496 [Ephemera danica]